MGVDPLHPITPRGPSRTPANSLVLRRDHGVGSPFHGDLDLRRESPPGLLLPAVRAARAARRVSAGTARAAAGAAPAGAASTHAAAAHAEPAAGPRHRAVPRLRQARVEQQALAGVVRPDAHRAREIEGEPGARGPVRAVL